VEPRPYWRQSDRAFNPNFDRLWVEPKWVFQLDKLLSGVVRERPPRPPDKERPAAADTADRTLVQTSKNQHLEYNCFNNKTEARLHARAVAVLLFRSVTL
jgi:hypothetical protein